MYRNTPTDVTIATGTASLAVSSACLDTQLRRQVCRAEHQRATDSWPPNAHVHVTNSDTAQPTYESLSRQATNPMDRDDPAPMNNAGRGFAADEGTGAACVRRCTPADEAPTRQQSTLTVDALPNGSSLAAYATKTSA
jgi:hypothetical protein